MNIKCIRRISFNVASWTWNEIDIMHILQEKASSGFIDISLLFTIVNIR